MGAPLATPGPAVSIRIREYRESDRDRLRAMTVEAFEGVSIDHNLDNLLGPVAGRDWRWRKARHVDEDLETPGGRIAVAERHAGQGCRVVIERGLLEEGFPVQAGYHEVAGPGRF